MQNQGYERSAPWRQALALLDQLSAAADAFDSDPFTMANRVRGLAIELPAKCATCFEQMDYDSAAAHANATREHLFKLRLAVQVAAHLGLINPRQLKPLIRQIDQLDTTLADLPDELFEDDGPTDYQEAA